MVHRQIVWSSDAGKGDLSNVNFGVAKSVEIGGNVGLEVDLTVAAAGVRARSGLEDSDAHDIRLTSDFKSAIRSILVATTTI